MLAQATSELPRGPRWRFEPKYDGVRIVAVATSSGVRLLSRDGNDKRQQFPEVAEALATLRAATGADFVLDGELVAVLSDGYAGFQALQSRIHLRKNLRIRLLAIASPASFVAFDALVIGARPLAEMPLRERRAALVNLLHGRTGPALRLAREGRSPDRMLAYAVRRNLEGVVAKLDDSRYEAGQRSTRWLKYKLTERQEFVVGGYTVSDRREDFGALLLGYYQGEDLVYAGSVGSGFSRQALAECARRIGSSVRGFCPFAAIPDLTAAERVAVRWTCPELVVDVAFERWPDGGKLRNPRFLGIRTDKLAREVGRARLGFHPAAAEAGR